MAFVPDWARRRCCRRCWSRAQWTSTAWRRRMTTSSCLRRHKGLRTTASSTGPGRRACVCLCVCVCVLYHPCGGLGGGGDEPLCLSSFVNVGGQIKPAPCGSARATWRSIWVYVFVYRATFGTHRYTPQVYICCVGHEVFVEQVEGSPTVQ